MSTSIDPKPALENPEEVRQKLEHWLAKELAVPLTIPSLEIPENTGMSNITLVFDTRTTTAEGIKTQSLVARIQPAGELLVFPHYDLDLQCRVMDTLGQDSGIPVPKVVAKELTGNLIGHPFYLMEREEGLIPPDMPPYHMDGWLMEQSPQIRETLWRAGITRMANIHKLPLDTVAPAFPPRRYAFPRSLNEQLKYWEDYYQWGYQFDDAFYTHEIVEQILPWLREHRPQEQSLRLCWGDARMANVIFNEQLDDVAALLDWEMIAYGDPQQDLAWWMYMDALFSEGLHVERLDGFPSQKQTATEWSALTGLHTDNLDYYRVFAGLRFALIMGRIFVGMGNQDAIDSQFNTCFAAQYLQKTLEAAKQNQGVIA